MGIFWYSAAVSSHFDEFDEDILAVELEGYTVRVGVAVSTADRKFSEELLYLNIQIRLTYKPIFIALRKLR
jgi:hypothetical protein